MKLKEIIAAFEAQMPFSIQESYDNSRLICGNSETEINAALISLDTTEEVVQEAINLGCNLIVSHHPILFKGLKSLNGKTYIERAVIKAIKNDISILAIHTNADNVIDGVNSKLSDLIGLKNRRVLSPKQGVYKLLRVGIPENENENFIKEVLHLTSFSQDEYKEAGTQFNTQTFYKKNDGEKVEVKEIMTEFLLPQHHLQAFLRILKQHHPFNEPVLSIIDVDNVNEKIGSGMFGELENEVDLKVFLEILKQKLNIPAIKFTGSINKKIKNIALCGGAGFFLLNAAKQANADVFITSDVKYHEFFDAENDITLIDVGHFESEQFTIDLLKDIIKRIFPTFAVHLTNVNTNPVNYFI